MKVLLPALAGGAVPMLAAEGTALAIEGGAVVADKSAIGADEEVAGEATALIPLIESAIDGIVV